VEGGRDFDEEVEDRIRLTRAYNEQVNATPKTDKKPTIRGMEGRRSSRLALFQSTHSYPVSAFEDEDSRSVTHKFIGGSSLDLKGRARSPRSVKGNSEKDQQRFNLMRHKQQIVKSLML
jgi:hypothetical protein